MGFIDFLVIGLYAAAVLAIGTAVGRRWPGADDFLLGDRRVPTGAVLLSLVATELSAATFVGVPADAYGKLAWTYLQFGIGSIFARIVLARWVVPLYHRRRVRTVYEFIGERFGTGARRGTAGTFLIGRLFASSVRLYIAAFAFSRVFGSGIEIAIIACGLIAAVYSIRGGIRAVIWTDALQGAVLLAGAVAVLATIAAQMPGGLTGVFEWARESGAIAWLSFDRPATGDTASAGDWLSLILRHDRHVITAVVGGFVLTLATHSTDHDMVQRLLTTKTGRQGGIALALSGFVNVPVVILFLSIGTGLAALAASGGGRSRRCRLCVPDLRPRTDGVPVARAGARRTVRGGDVEPRLGDLCDRSDLGGRSRRNGPRWGRGAGRSKPAQYPTLRRIADPGGRSGSPSSNADSRTQNSASSRSRSLR